MQWLFEDVLVLTDKNTTRPAGLSAQQLAEKMFLEA